MLTQSNATSPFSLSAKKKVSSPAAAGQSKPTASAAITPGPTAPQSSPSPAKTQYIQNVAQQQYAPDLSGIQSSLQGINSTIDAMRGQQTAPTSNPASRYQSAMQEYIRSLMPSSEDDALQSRYSDLLDTTAQGQKRYASQIEQLGKLGAGAVAGNLSTGTNVVGSGNAAIASQSASQRMNALADAQSAALQGAQFEGDSIQNELARRAAQRQQASGALKARADYEQSLLTPTEINGALIRMNPETGAYEEVYSPQVTPEPFELSEGQSRYEYDPATGQYREIASKAKTYAPSTTGADGARAFTATQKSNIDYLNSLMASLESYKNLYDSLVGQRGTNLVGEDAGRLAGAYNALLFQIAQAAGTGALQAADREVVEAMIPNPTALSAAFGNVARGGKAGGLGAIAEARNLFENRRNAIISGSIPSTLDAGASGNARELIRNAGYDYDAIKRDNPNISDEQILEDLGLS
jgi:hypothetical protein